jgi:hypothetical protein
MAYIVSVAEIYREDWKEETADCLPLQKRGLNILSIEKKEIRHG